MKPYSITRRLIVTVLLIELVSALCVTGVALVYERHTHFRSFDVLLRGRADSMMGAVQDAEDANDNIMLDGTEASVPPQDIYAVIDANGRVLGKSAEWRGIPERCFRDRVRGDESGSEHREMDQIKSNLRPDREAFLNMDVDGKAYRVIRIDGLRIVDPGDKGGGIPRAVRIYYGSPTDYVWRAVFRSAGFYAVSSLVVLAATGVLMSWLLNRGLAPLRQLAAGAAQVSVTSWDFSAPQSARMSRELAPLVTALESVLLGLQRSFEQQRRFVGDAAHELKTSVAVVKSSLQLLNMKQRTAEEYEAGLVRCIRDCERIETVVAQMLTLARVEESRNDDHLSNVTNFVTDIFAGVMEAAEQLAAMAEVWGISIEIGGVESMPASVFVQPVLAQPVLVEMDGDLFQLLCLNLLMNALQHSPQGSVVTVEIQQGGGFAEMRISDRGEGIATEDIPHVFERFFRNDPSRSRKTGGTGLGLAICKAIAERFGGSIGIVSGLHKGCLVVTRFPLSKIV